MSPDFRSLPLGFPEFWRIQLPQSPSRRCPTMLYHTAASGLLDLKTMIALRTIFPICVVLSLLICISSDAQAQQKSQLETAKLKPYIFFRFSNDSPADHNYGAFHYTNVHRTLPPEMVGNYYQSGLFHTWYRPVKIYGKKDFSRDKYGYHAMEGGAGYKPYLRFRDR